MLEYDPRFHRIGNVSWGSLAPFTLHPVQRTAYPDAIVVAHPECREDILALADEICSTSGMMQVVQKFPNAKTFLIATENGIIHQLKQRYPDREFIVADGCIGCRLHCPYMKMIDLPAVLRSLEEEVFEIKVDPDVAKDALTALQRMMSVPRDN